MKKKIFIVLICIIILLLFGIIIFNRMEENYDSVNYGNYNVNNENKETTMPNNDTVTGKIENINIQGIVELHHNGFIYIFNGQHFGEYGFEMEEYTRANIDDKNQKCVDYFTSKEYDTSYIEEGDLIICTGDLIKYSTQNDDLDTKDNPIIVLKSDDYMKMKQETVEGKRTAVVTVGEYFDFNGEIYLKYEISDKGYKLPFALKFNINDDNAKVIGSLEKDKKVEVKYKDPSVSLEQLKLESIEVIEN